MSIRSFLLIFIVVVFDSLLYCQGSAYKSRPLPTNAELSGGLSGLNLPGYGFAACAASYPASTSVPCFPVDPQSVAYGLTGGNPMRHANGTPTLWPELPVREAVLIGVDALIIVFALIFAGCLVLLVQSETRRFFHSRSRQRGRGEETIVETVVVSLAVTRAPSMSRNLASQRHASSRHPRASVFLPSASVSENSVRWQLRLRHDGSHSDAEARI